MPDSTIMDGPDKEVTEREKWNSEKEFRERELQLKAQEVEISRRESSSSQWRNPLVLALLAAAVAAAGNAIVAIVNGNLQRQLEDERSEQARILEVIKVGNPDKAAENLDFLLKSGLIRNADQVDSLNKFLKARLPGTGPSLPSSDISARSAAEEADSGRANNVAKGIIGLLQEKKYSEIWDSQVSAWFKQRYTKNAFIANILFTRANLGSLRESALVSTDYSKYDPSTDYRGAIYTFTFLDKYDAGRVYDRIVLIKDEGEIFRLAGIYFVPEGTSPP